MDDCKFSTSSCLTFMEGSSTDIRKPFGQRTFGFFCNMTRYIIVLLTAIEDDEGTIVYSCYNVSEWSRWQSVPSKSFGMTSQFYWVWHLGFGSKAEYETVYENFSFHFLIFNISDVLNNVKRGTFCLIPIWNWEKREKWSEPLRRDWA